jgi:DNA (cytosine-5)-methyltransferase 1
MTLTHVDLFSGIGGFALAARWNGIETIQFVEIDPFCRKVLQKNFPGVNIHDDIKTFTNTDCNRFNGQTIPIRSRESQQESSLPTGCNQRSFLLTGGFPCQPFSCAGKRRGTDDDRHLWPHMLRVIQELRPRWVIAENVSGLVNIKNVVEQGGDADMEDEALDGGEGGVSTSTLVSILTDLEESGYSVQVYIIPACAVGAPHRRDRVWICARRPDSHAPDSDDRHEPSRGVWAEGIATESGNREAVKPRPKNSNCGADAPDSDTSGLQEPWAEQRTSGMRQSIQGGECWSQPWTEVAARFCRVDARVPNRVDRLKSLGNAIVPQVASELMRAILEAEGGK